MTKSRTVTEVQTTPVGEQSTDKIDKNKINMLRVCIYFSTGTPLYIDRQQRVADSEEKKMSKIFSS